MSGHRFAITSYEYPNQPRIEATFATRDDAEKVLSSPHELARQCLILDHSWFLSWAKSLRLDEWAAPIEERPMRK